MSRYYASDGPTRRSRLTNTRVIATDLTSLKERLEDAFDDVQADIDAGPGGAGLQVFDVSASSMWIINHNLGRDVSVDVLNSGGAKIGAEVVLTTTNQARVYFEVPVPGRALVR